MDGETKKKILLAMAHPDDEVIFGWPFLQDDSLDKELLICVSDEHNKEKQWGARRREALGALCSHLGIRYTCLELNSGFYMSPDRKKKKHGFAKLVSGNNTVPLLRDVCASILDAIAKSDCDAIFTHNFWGEYGHMDHMLVNTLIFGNVAKPIFVSDAMLPLYWMPLAPGAPAVNAVFAGRPHSSHTMNVDFYEKCAAFYKNNGTWTWDQPPMQSATMYRFG